MGVVTGWNLVPHNTLLQTHFASMWTLEVDGAQFFTSVVKYLNDYTLSSPTQHGFQNGFSCDTQLVEFYHGIASSVDTESMVKLSVFFFTFKKAFDTVPHP